MSMRFTILGCGSSGGVPRVGNIWGNCDPANPRNRRRRCSLLVEKFGKGGATTVLVDTSPDLREQLLTTRVATLDAVLFTHEHADHTHGIDDLRGFFFNARRRIDIYADARTQRLADAALRLLLRAAAGLVLSRHPQCARHQPARTDPHRWRRRDDRGRADRAGARRRALARLSLRRSRLLPRRGRHPRRLRCRRCRGSMCGSSTRCGRCRIRATSASSRPWRGSSGWRPSAPYSRT